MSKTLITATRLEHVQQASPQVSFHVNAAAHISAWNNHKLTAGLLAAIKQQSANTNLNDRLR